MASSATATTSPPLLWPEPLEAALVQDEIELMLQVNGKLRGAVRVAADAPEGRHRGAAPCPRRWPSSSLEGRAKKVGRAGRLVNIVWLTTSEGSIHARLYPHRLLIFWLAALAHRATALAYEGLRQENARRQYEPGRDINRGPAVLSHDAYEKERQRLKGSSPMNPRLSPAAAGPRPARRRTAAAGRLRLQAARRSGRCLSSRSIGMSPYAELAAAIRRQIRANGGTCHHR